MRLVAKRFAARLRAVLDNRALTAADTWERHLVVARLAGNPVDLIDVGGMPAQLAGFLPRTRVVAANVAPPADVVVPADALPFADGAFAAATSLDALEHVPPPQRARFVREILRVARDRAVLCCPLGTRAHVAAEAELQDWYRSLTGEGHPWLAEHARNGLPTLEELHALFSDHPGSVRFLFHGDFRDVERQFKILVLARFRKRPADLAAYARFRLPYRPQTTLNGTPSDYTNRVFVLADRAIMARS